MSQIQSPDHPSRWMHRFQTFVLCKQQHYYNYKTWQLRMHCNLRPPERRQHFPALITTPCQVWSRWTYPLPYYSVFAADTLLYAVTLTVDHWPWTFAVYCLWCDKTLCQIWTQSNNPRRSSIFDLMTLNIVLSVALGSGIIFTKYDLRQLIRAWIVACFDANMLFHAVTSTFDPLTLKVRGTPSITWSKSVRNLSEIEQSPAELLIILRIFAHVMSCHDFDLWPLELELFSTSDVLCLNSLQNLSEIE